MKSPKQALAVWVRFDDGPEAFQIGTVKARTKAGMHWSIAGLFLAVGLVMVFRLITDPIFGRRPDGEGP